MESTIIHAVEWTPIGQTSNQLILYHPLSHALQVQPRPALPTTPGPSNTPLLLPYNEPLPEIVSHRVCPYCSQSLPTTPPTRSRPLSTGSAASDIPHGPAYFRILARAHEGSRPSSPTPTSERRFRSITPTDQGSNVDVPAKGYYERFFKEEGRLGIGAEGSVYLATHVIGGNVLGTYAVKKIAVGTSKEYLVRMLHEVRLLETLRHPNIIPYHHSWMDLTSFSSFGPPIMALHILMMYATAGNLDGFLLNRAHATQPARPDLSAGDIMDGASIGQLPREERIKAFKKRRQSGTSHKSSETRGVLLLRLEEVAKLFGDVVDGLAFLHANSVLHLDLKCSNVLLHWEEGKLIPKAMISDFGTSQEMLRGKRERTGHTGTMEYMAPETLATDALGHWRPSDSHADMWSLGMILHKLLFLQLPYSDTEDFDNLKRQILHYQGFIPDSELVALCERRHIPRDLLLLLSKLVHVVPEARPSAEKVRTGLKGLRPAMAASGKNSLVARSARMFSNVTELNDESHPSPNNSSREWINPVSLDRPILALPSPERELEPHFSHPASLWSKRYLWSNARLLLLLLKILSLQPQISHIRLPIPLLIILICLTMCDLKFSLPFLGMSSFIHVVIMFMYFNQPNGMGDISQRSYAEL